MRSLPLAVPGLFLLLLGDGTAGERADEACGLPLEG